MAFDPITAGLEFGSKLLDALGLDPQAAADSKLKLLQLQQTGQLAQLTSDTQLAQAQAEIDKAEAASNDPLQHWRGAAGWICAVSMGYEFLAAPVGNGVAALIGHPEKPFPELDVQTFMPLLFGMLGLGAYHTYEAVSK